MNVLPLSMLTVQPISIPQYRNDRLRSFALWLQDNDKALTTYYNALKPFCEEGVEPLVDYWTFSATQHEREEMKLNTMARLPHGASL